MPILSEAGSDRADILNNARKYTLEFDTVGAEAIMQVPRKNRNIKIALVTDTFFHRGDPSYDINNYDRFGRTTRSLSPTIERIFNILKIPDTKEVFGLTYRDLLEMDETTLTYVHDAVYELYKERLKIQQEQEKLLNGK